MALPNASPFHVTMSPEESRWLVCGSGSPAAHGTEHPLPLQTGSAPICPIPSPAGAPVGSRASQMVLAWVTLVPNGEMAELREGHFCLEIYKYPEFKCCFICITEEAGTPERARVCSRVGSICVDVRILLLQTEFGPFHLSRAACGRSVSADRGYVCSVTAPMGKKCTHQRRIIALKCN